MTHRAKKSSSPTPWARITSSTSEATPVVDRAMMRAQLGLLHQGVDVHPLDDLLDVHPLDDLLDVDPVDQLVHVDPAD